MAAAPTGTAEPHMAAAPQQLGGAPHGSSALTIRRSPHRSDSIRQKPDKPKTNIMKRVGEQK